MLYLNKSKTQQVFQNVFETPALKGLWNVFHSTGNVDFVKQKFVEAQFESEVSCRHMLSTGRG